eukprot:4077173-Lingulodinium_polyedra.AAC.1
MGRHARDGGGRVSEDGKRKGCVAEGGVVSSWHKHLRRSVVCKGRAPYRRAENERGMQKRSNGDGN